MEVVTEVRFGAFDEHSHILQPNLRKQGLNQNYYCCELHHGEAVSCAYIIYEISFGGCWGKVIWERRLNRATRLPRVV